VAIMIGPAEVAPAHAGMEGQVIRASRRAAVRDTGCLHAREDLVELLISASYSLLLVVSMVEGPPDDLAG
jgi:hypothetical protein